MEDTLTQIKNWMKIHSPQTLTHLNRPASQAQIDEVEAQIGMSLPHAFKEFLKRHDGEDGETWLALFGNGNQLLSCQAIVEQYALDQKIGRSVYDPEMETIAFWKDRVAGNVIFINGTVKPLMLHPKWVPITCMNGDVLRYIDFDPAPGGTPGQIIEVDPENCSYQVLASSFDALLDHYLAQLLCGEFAVDNEGYVESCEEASMEWGVPEWLSKS